MTVSNTIRYGFLSASGVGPYDYGYKILSAAEFEVYLAGSLTTAYSLTGVGNDTGGTFTLGMAPPAGTIIFHRGKTGQTQQTDYDSFTGLPFTGTGHEQAIDKLTLLVQEIQEQLSRIPALPVDIGTAIRGIFYPTPVPLKLWGWDALGTGIAYYDPAIVQVTVGTTAHLAYGETQVVVPTVSGAAQLTSGTVFPAGCIRLSALVRVTTTFGASLGLSTFAAGSPSTMERWGATLSRVATAAPVGANNPGMFVSYEQRPIPANEAVMLTANEGTFDSAGVALITGTYLMFTAA